MDRALHLVPSHPDGAQRRGRRGFFGFGCLSLLGPETLRFPIALVPALVCITVRCRSRSRVAMLLAVVLLLRDRVAMVRRTIQSTLRYRITVLTCTIN